MKIYMENKAYIARHNHRAHRGMHSYFLKMNHFGDHLHHEFTAKMGGCYRADLKNLTHVQDQIAGMAAPFIPPHNFEAPAEVDWRKKGAVTPVKNQGQCGSCWDFSTKYGNHGCSGGLMDLAFKYIRDNHGLDTEQSSPYEGQDARCQFKRSDVGADDKGYVDVPTGDEEALAKALAFVGPVSVAIDASHRSFQFYSHGIYDEPDCSPQALDHGVLAVGYGPGYFLVKNSWGETWGDGGYVKMTRSGQNQCGIASSASYPLV